MEGKRKGTENSDVRESLLLYSWCTYGLGLILEGFAIMAHRSI